jgi:hypothetical protein
MADPPRLIFREHPAVENTALLSCNTPNNSIAPARLIFARLMALWITYGKPVDNF